MNKTFTLRLFNYSLKVLLVTVIICSWAFVQPNVANAGTEHPYIQAKTIKCYPNPAISFVNFEFLTDYISKDYSLQIYSFTGKKMYELNITSAKATLTFTNEFYRGIYVYQLRDKDGKILETGKFQVNR